jgi:hypothetical protein
MEALVDEKKVNSDMQYRIDVIKDLESMESIREIWQQFDEYPNSSLDIFKTILDNRDEIERPHIIVLCERQKPVSLLIGRIENIMLKNKLGYKVVYKTMVKSLSILHNGLLGEKSDLIGGLMATELLRTVKENEVDMIFLNNLKVESFLYQNLLNKSPSLFRAHGLSKNLHWKLNGLTSYETFYGNRTRRTKKNIRSWPKKLERDFNGRVEVKLYDSITDLEKIINDTENVAKKTYHRGLGMSFSDSPETRSVVDTSLRSNWFTAWILYIDNKPHAFCNGFEFGDTFYGYHMGYDPDYRNYGLGHVVILQFIKDICANENVNKIDFGLGDAAYKRELCDEYWNESMVYLFSHNFKGLINNMIKSGTTLLNTGMKMVSDKLNLRSRVKRIWRDYFIRHLK